MLLVRALEKLSCCAPCQGMRCGDEAWPCSDAAASGHVIVCSAAKDAGAHMCPAGHASMLEVLLLWNAFLAQSGGPSPSSSGATCPP